MSLLANSNAMTAQGGGYTISNSLRFQSASSTYLNRTFSTPTNNTTWSFSCWLKRGSLSSVQGVISSTNAGLFFSASDAFYITNNAGTVAATSTAVFRDPSAWYHIFVVSNGTTIVGYINNAQVFSFTGTITNFNSAIAHGIGRFQSGASQYFDGYMADIYLVDGQALTPSSFGISDPYTGQWEAKKYTGTYGTNGFYLPFSNGTSTVTLGVDYSGNNNNWALNAFTRSAGVSDCWMKDVPSGNGFGGLNASSNYAVLNPLSSSTNMTISGANLNITSGTTAVNFNAYSSIGASSGKYYCEVNIVVGANADGVGVCPSTLQANSNRFDQVTGGVAYFGSNGNKGISGVQSAYGATYTTGDVIGIALDMDSGSVTFYKNGVSQGVAATGLSGQYVFATADGSSGTGINQALNFGQRSFAYTPPTGFLPLCTANLSSPTIWQGNKYMDATTYTGNGTTQTVTNAGSFQPDLVWIKGRSAATNNGLQDSVRGTASGILVSNSTAAESAGGAYISSLNSNGFTVNNNTSGNGSAATYVGWQWQAGQGTTSSNTQGSITSTVSVNTTAGFSIVTYTGTGANATVGHGLGVAPKMIIVKDRTQVNSWGVYHDAIGNTRILFLESTSAQQTSSTAWNNTSPTSTVFTIGATGTTNQNTKGFVAYCFAEIAGFSKFGSYTGNGSTDGPFVYCGFRPKFVLTKGSSAITDWVIHDTSRNTYNVADASLYPNTSGAETTSEPFDILSNGFKLRTTAGNVNNNGTTYIYMAFAESPFNFSNAR